MRVMVKKNGRDDTGPLTFEDSDAVTLVTEVGHSDKVWRLSITVGNWNGIPRVEKVSAEDYVDASISPSRRSDA